MNPYISFSDLLFTCVDAPKGDIVTIMLSAFNEPNQWSQRDAAGVPTVQFFTKEVDHDFSLAYLDKAERDTTKPQQVLLWQPRIHPRTTVFMGRFRDGMSHSVFRLSEMIPASWINARIYDDPIFPGCFFDYYSNYRKISRRLMSSKDEEGWEFVAEGAIQPFENPDYYCRRLKKDRLDREIITEYLSKLGFMITQDGFWETNQPANLIWQERPQ